MRCDGEDGASRARSRRWRIGTAFASWWLACVCAAAEPDSLSVRAWTLEDGLPHPNVRRPIEDARGYLWFGSPGGLIRFDGARFRVHDVASDPGLPTNAIGPLAGDGDGRLWIGTREGLAVRERDVIRGGLAGVPAGAVTALTTAADGTVWVAVYDHGLYRGGVDGFVQALPASRLPAGSIVALQAIDGALWIGATLGGAARYAGGALTVFDADDGMTALQVTDFARLADGSVLLLTPTALLRHVDGRLRPATSEALQERLPPLVSLLVDSRGDTWVGSIDGLFRISPDGTDAERFDQAAGLSSNGVGGLLEDSAGQLWVGSRNGLNRLARPPVARVRLPVDARATMACEDGVGTRWVDTDREIVMFDAGTGLTRHPLPHAGSAAHCRARGGLLLGVRGEIVELSARADTSVSRARLPDDLRHVVVGLIEDRDGHLWVGTNGGGLHHFRNGALARRLTRAEGLPNDVVFTVAQASDGTVWVGTERGVARVDPDGRLLPPIAGLDTLPFAWTFLERDGAMWIGSGAGVTRVDRDGTVRTLGAREGLSTDSARHMAFDGNGALWVAGDLGVARVPASMVRAYFGRGAPRVSSVRLGLSDGVRGGAVAQYQPRGLTDRAGGFWFVDADGLSRIDLRTGGAPLPPPRPWLESVERDADPPRPASAPASLRFEAGTRRVAFDVSVPALVAPERVRWRYRLAGLDTAWTDAAPGQTRAVYTHLPAGRFRFEYEASRDGERWRAGTPLSLEQAPVFYRTPGFVLACLATIALAAAAMHRAWRRRLEARHEAVLAERSRMARDLHDTLLQNLGGVALQLHAVERTLASRPEAAPAMVRALIDDASRSLVEARDVVWDLREPPPPRLAHALRALVDGARARHPEVDIALALEADDTHLRPETAQALARVAEEALANALAHGGGAAVRVALRGDRANGLVLDVEDDGPGFVVQADRAGLGGHWGVLGMRERMQRVRGRLTIDSAPGRGARVRAELPA